MNLQEHTTPAKLERYSFLWSEARLLIAAIALFLGGVPPVMFLFGRLGFSGQIFSLLNVAWIISGIVSVYLLYLWNKNGKTIFGGKNTKDTIAFFVNIVSGLNLGIVGILGQNIGMTITPGAIKYPVFILAGLVYLAAGWHLWNRWKSRGEKVF